MLTEFAFLFPVLNQKKGIYGSVGKKKNIKIAPESINLKAFILDLAVMVHLKA